MCTQGGHLLSRFWSFGVGIILLKSLQLSHLSSSQICKWIFSLTCIPIFNCQEKIQQQKQFNHNSEFWFDEKEASSDIHTFNFNLLICSPQFIRYKLRMNRNLNINSVDFSLLQTFFWKLVLPSNTDRSWGNAVVLPGRKVFAAVCSAVAT